MRAERDSGDRLRFSSDTRPVVVWNLTSKCNLECAHCYAAARSPDEDELSTREGRALIADLASMGVPVLLFSGGEPLMREDVFELAAFAHESGLRTALSTNGTLITPAVARPIKDAAISYVGVSIDGTRETHDRFRNREGALADALAGLNNAAREGLRTGIRFTLTADNFADLPSILDLVESEGIDRFCLYHLVYSGRGRALAGRDVTAEQSRGAVELLIERALDWAARNVETEILTADNHADGVLVLAYVEGHFPERADEVRRLLAAAGGCSAGRKIAAVDPAGEVRPCQFWSHESVGNVRRRPFSDIWADASSTLLSMLRATRVTDNDASRCARCAHVDICRGCRIRALVATGDQGKADPQCYLHDVEIGL
jgi:radical SAM protein with 4Fe4S-binding SPASM domain